MSAITKATFVPSRESSGERKGDRRGEEQFPPVCIDSSRNGGERFDRDKRRVFGGELRCGGEEWDPSQFDAVGAGVHVSAGRASRDHATVLDQNECGVLWHRRRALEHGEQRTIKRDGHGDPCYCTTAPRQSCRRADSGFPRNCSEGATSQLDTRIVGGCERLELGRVLAQHRVLE